MILGRFLQYLRYYDLRFLFPVVVSAISLLPFVAALVIEFTCASSILYHSRHSVQRHFYSDQNVVAHPGVCVGPSGSIAGCVERKNCDPRHARRVMQDSIACTAWNIAKVALHAY